MIASSKQKQDFLSNLINSYIIDMTSKELYVLDQGYNRLHDKVVYALGDIIINSDSPDFISHSPHKVKPHPKDKLYYKWLLTFSKLGDIFPALLIASLVPYIKPLLNESSICDSDFAVCIYGETGSGKTSVAKLLTSIFTKDKNRISLSSDKKSIYELSEFKDTCVLIDDLNKTDSSRVKNSNEEKISRIIQQKNSGGEIKYKGKIAKIDSMIFITAEYLPKTLSTINRCLIAEMPDIDINKLTYLQDEQGLYVEFIIDFIGWVCKNFQKLISWISDEKKYSLASKSNKDFDPNVNSGAYRIARTAWVLNLILKLFYAFMGKGEKFMNLIPKKLSHFQLSIDICISDTLDLTKKESDEFKQDYVDVILNVFIF